MTTYLLIGAAVYLAIGLCIARAEGGPNDLWRLRLVLIWPGWVVVMLLIYVPRWWWLSR